MVNTSYAKSFSCCAYFFLFQKRIICFWDISVETKLSLKASGWTFPLVAAERTSVARRRTVCCFFLLECVILYIL